MSPFPPFATSEQESMSASNDQLENVAHSKANEDRERIEMGEFQKQQEVMRLENAKRMQEEKKKKAAEETAKREEEEKKKNEPQEMDIDNIPAELIHPPKRQQETFKGIQKEDALGSKKVYFSRIVNNN